MDSAENSYTNHGIRSVPHGRGRPHRQSQLETPYMLMVAEIFLYVLSQ